MPNIVEVWKRLGGGPIQRGRGQAFWRDSQHWNIAINEEKGLFFDHARAFGGSHVSLIMHVLECTPEAAGRWLQQEFGPKQEDLSPAEWRAYTAPAPPFVPTKRPFRKTQLAPLDKETAWEFKNSLTWHIESDLETYKAVFSLDPPAAEPWEQYAAMKCARLTRQLERVQRWTMPYAFAVYERMEQRFPDWLDYIICEGEYIEKAFGYAMIGRL